jgi:surfeit locus 1 family protein
MVLSIIKLLFSRKHILASLLVLAAMAIMARLGVWQLDRLSQRRASNAVLAAQLNAPQLDLNHSLSGDAFISGSSLIGMQYRSVVVRGTYDFAHQVGLRNQVWGDQFGYDLLTPLHISGSGQIVLVDRGWVPKADFEAGRLSGYNEKGEVTIQGVILDSQTHASLGPMQDPPYNPSQPTTAFFIANMNRIDQELPFPLLPIYIQQTPDPAWAGPPYREPFNLVLSDGPHLSYAIQWFCFALILGTGYPILVLRNRNKATGIAANNQNVKSDQRSGINEIR